MEEINKSLLETIDCINESVVESELAVMNSMIDFYNKQSAIIEYCDDVNVMNDMMIQESGDGNILSKIWNAIKKFFGMIVKSIKKIINSIRNKATTNTAGNNPVESVSVIAEEVLSKGASRNKPDNIDAWPVPKVNPKYIVKDGPKPKSVKEGYVENFGNAMMYFEGVDDIADKAASSSGSQKVQIDVDPASEIPGRSLELKDNEFQISFIDNNKTLKITFLGFGKFSKTHIKDNGESTVPGQEKEWYQSPKMALHLMTHDDARNKITELVTLALKVMKDRKPEDIKELKKSEKVALLFKGMASLESMTYKIPISQITAVQAWASKMLESMEAFTSTNVSLSELDTATVKSLNDIVRILMRIQISLNFISTALNEDSMMLIDKRFYKSIKSLDLLDEFVGKCIQSGVPPKYVAYNAWLISDECIRGTGEYKPIFGHARATLFPPNKKIVLKIGLSGLGTVSNETESRFSKIFEDMDRVDLIAPVIKDFKNNAIIAMERVDGNFDLSKTELTNYAKTASKALEDYQEKTGKKLNIKLSVASQHIGNVAFDYKYNVYRSIDYGVHYREPNKK